MTELPHGWAKVNVKEVLSVEYGSALPAARRAGGPVPVYGSSGIVGWHNEAAVLTPSVIVGRKGNAGACHVVPGPSWPIDTTYFIKVPVGLDAKFVGWQLGEAAMRQLDSSTAIPSLRRQDLERQELRIAPLAEQRRIVAAVEELLSRLEVAASALSAALARAGLLRAAILERIFSEPWPRGTIGGVAALADGPFGSNLKTAHYVDEGPRVVRLQNIGDGIFRNERAHITPEHFDMLSKHAVEPGDIVAASLGEDAPRACLVPGWLGPAIVKADCIRIRPTGNILNAYLMWALNSRPLKQQAASRIKGIGRPRLGLAGLRDLQVPIPPIDVQRRACDEIDLALSSVQGLMERVRAARLAGDAVRRSILARAFRGELVPQGPDDEPASVLLERIAAERATAPKPSRKRRERTPA